MPIFPYQCQECGNIQDELVKHWSDIPDMQCEMKCKEPNWKKHHEILVAPSDRLSADNARFPHATHMRETFVEMTPKGPQLASRRIWAKSRRHMEQLMQKHGYVYYEEPLDGGAQGREPQIPDDLKIWADHPSVRRYHDLQKEGKIPTHMILTEDELKERFHVE